jgi:Holliday junction DNA helicase RuvB
MTEKQKNEINDVQPSSLRHIVGQKSVVEAVTVAIDACQMDARRFDHALMVGPPGTGKTAICQILAAELAADYFEILGQSIKNASDLNGVLLAATPGSILFFDEAHELKKEFQTALYLALDKRKIILSGGGKSSGTPQSLPLADFGLVLASTDEHCLLQPLRDRMRLLLRFSYYSVEELTTILLQRARALGWDIHEELLPQIAQRSRGTPRLSLRILQACRRVCRSEGEHTITAAHLERACVLDQLDDLGLGPTEQQYLNALAEGNSRFNVLSSILGLPSRTVSTVIEPFLIRVGLIVKDDAGRRQLSGKGREHLSRSRAVDV